MLPLGVVLPVKFLPAVNCASVKGPMLQPRASELIGGAVGGRLGVGGGLHELDEVLLAAVPAVVHHLS